jgi:purine nucleosidase
MPDQTRSPIIIDTDPGQDDAVAILFALGASDRLDLRAITAVAGNVPLSLTAKNARLVLGWANRTDIPVYAGCPRPLVREPVTAEHVHGETGLAGVPLDEPKVELANGHAVDFLTKVLVNAWPATITLCLLGPMTNLAAALVQEPEIRHGINEVVLMGGGCQVRGNVTPTAEFNIYADPEAAAVVFGSGIPIVVMPLDVTHQVPATKERVSRLESLGNRAGALIAALLRSHGLIDSKKMGTDGAPLHDPTVIAYLLQPSLFSGRKVNVTVETRGEFTVGETVVDWRGVTNRPANALWFDQVDSNGFYELLTDTVKRLP